MTKDKWFKPLRTTGFKKNYTIEQNIATMVAHIDGRWSDERKILTVAKQALALANVTQDSGTQRKAKMVSNRAFKMYSEVQKGKSLKLLTKSTK